MARPLRTALQAGTDAGDGAVTPATAPAEVADQSKAGDQAGWKRAGQRKTGQQQTGQQQTAQKKVDQKKIAQKMTTRKQTAAKNNSRTARSGSGTGKTGAARSSSKREPSGQDRAGEEADSTPHEGSGSSALHTAGQLLGGVQKSLLNKGLKALSPLSAFEEVFDQRVAAALARLDMPPPAELALLREQIDELTKRLDALSRPGAVRTGPDKAGTDKAGPEEATEGARKRSGGGRRGGR